MDGLLIQDLRRQVNKLVVLQVLDKVYRSVQALPRQLVELEYFVDLYFVILDGNLLFLIVGVAVEFLVVVLREKANLLLEVVQLTLTRNEVQILEVLLHFLVECRHSA